MKKIILVLFIIFIILININVFSQEYNLKEDDIDIETSIVLLNIYNKDEIVKRNYFFEILDYNDEGYILIPVNLLSNTLDLVIIYDRLSNIISIKNPDNEKQVKIDLTEKKYLDYSQLNEPFPVVYANDIFVNSEVISYIFNAEINWNTNYQELNIIGEFNDEEVEQEELIDTKDKEKIIEEQKDEVLGEKSKFSLGSINYKIIANYRKLNDNTDNLILREITSIFGRAGNWALSLRGEGEINYFEQNSDINLPFIKGKYEDKNKLIVIGDSEINFNNTIGKKSLRGLYLRKPNELNINIIPMIDINGKTTPDSIVELYVNNKSPIEFKVKEDGKYNFEEVELSLRILNRIKIVINKPDGEIEIIDKKITSTERILKKGTSELEVIGGAYKGGSKASYDGLITGYKGAYALNEDMSFRTEANYYDTRYLEENENYISSNLGFAYRLIDNTIISLDWYYGNYQETSEQGYKANIHYAFNRGYLDGYYIYINEELSELVDETSGKEQKIMGVFSFNKNWAIEPTIGIYESLNNDSQYKNEYVKLRLRGRNGWGHNIAIIGSYENIEKNYLLPINNFNYLFPGVNDRYGVGIEFKQYKVGYNIKAGLNIYNNDIQFSSDSKLTYKEIDYNINFYKVLTNNLLFTGKYNTAYDTYNGIIRNNDEETRTRIRYNIADRTALTLSNSNTSLQTSNYRENKNSAIVNSYLGNNISIYGKYSSIDSNSFLNYKELNLDVGYMINNNAGYINIFGNYTIPENEIFEPHIGYGFGYSYMFDNYGELEFEAGKNFQSVLSNNYDHYFVISYSHGLSFTDNKILDSRFNSNSHRSIVGGYVYLDENNNGIYDQGEDTLSNIEMRLDNLTVKTNENGEFRFHPLFSGDYILDFNYRNLAADYTPITKEKLIILRENENIFENFGLTLNGSISGKVFLDKNNNGKEDEDESTVSWIGILLDGKKYAYTDKRGEFYFENISLGTHKLEIIQESLPSSITYSIKRLGNINITKDNLDVNNIIIPLYYNF